MKITNNHRTKGTKFSDLSPGNCFLFGEGVYMCFDGSSEFNALNLRSGSCSNFAKHVKVTPVDAELTVK